MGNRRHPRKAHDQGYNITAQEVTYRATSGRYSRINVSARCHSSTINHGKRMPRDMPAIQGSVAVKKLLDGIEIDSGGRFTGVSRHTPHRPLHHSLPILLPVPLGSTDSSHIQCSCASIHTLCCQVYFIVPLCRIHNVCMPPPPTHPPQTPTTARNSQQCP